MQPMTQTGNFSPLAPTPNRSNRVRQNCVRQSLMQDSATTIPCEVLIEEAQNAFPAAKELHILNIETGLGDVVTIKDSRVFILIALTMARSSTEVVNRLRDKYGNTNSYYRFNVDRCLDDVTLGDWENASTISGQPSPLVATISTQLFRLQSQ